MSPYPVHIHYSTTARDCDGPLDTWGVMPCGWRVTMCEALEDLIADQHHRCVRHGCGDYANLGHVDHDAEDCPHPVEQVRIGGYCDEYEHQRSLSIEALMILDEGVPRVGQYVVTSGAPHEEGGSSTEWRVCDDDCDTGPSTRGQRDHFAEAAGY